MPKVTPNSNFHSLGGGSIPTAVTPEYQEYRRCWEENPRNFILRDFPLHLDLEASSRCNLRCTFCDKLPLLSTNQLGDMDYALFMRILDEGKEHGLWGLKLSYRGEPLINPRISEMVAYAKKQGVLDVYFNTNAMLLTEAQSNKLIDAGLDRISISIEGTDPAAFEKERVGARFDSVVRNFQKLIELRERRGVSYPKVRVQTVIYPGLDLIAYKKHWAPLCDEVAAVDYKDESNRRTELEHDWACPQLWQRMTVEWDGTVLACNNDDLRGLSPGNAAVKSIHECWHDPMIQAVRDHHRAGKSHEVADCDGCPWRTAQITKLMPPLSK